MCFSKQKGFWSVVMILFFATFICKGNVMNGVELAAINNGCAKVGPLAKSCAKVLEKDLVIIQASYFADSETHIVLQDHKNLKDKTVLFIVQFSFAPNCSINMQLMNLFFSISVAKSAGAKKIVAFLPYLPYARQEVSEVGKGLGVLGCVSNLFKTVGVDRIISCDLHEPSVISDLSINVDEIRLEPFWAKMIADGKVVDFEKNKKNIVIASPDAGGIDRAKKIASILNLDFVYVEKERIDADQTVAKSLRGDVKDKIVILVDDIIDTGGTAINACDLFVENGASAVYGCFSHGVLSLDSAAKIEKSKFSKIFVTDSVLLEDRGIGGKIEDVSVDSFACENFLNLLEK